MRLPPVFRRGLPLVCLTLMLSVPLAAFSVTKEQVNAACRDSEAALNAYRAAQDEFLEASLAFEEAANDVARVERQQVNISGAIETRQKDMDAARGAALEKAVEMYMRGASGAPGLLLSLDNVSEAMTSSEMLAAASADDQASLDNLLALEAELSRFQVELTDVEAELRTVEAQRLEAVNRQETARDDSQAAFANLSERCKELNRTYEQERAAAAAKAAAEAQGKSGAAAGASAESTSGFICPITPGRSSFIDSWGFARSGGRAHKGTDMMADWNEPTLAVVDGVVSVRSGGLGGRVAWLVGSNGTAYYYAHLSDWAVGSGTRVSRGQVVGYVGDSGNASGGSPHLHFEIHPGGRGAAAVNPYPTLASACF